MGKSDFRFVPALVKTDLRQTALFSHIEWEVDLGSIEKWVERLYAETDFGRSVATSISGILGLTIYLISKDWVVSAFVVIIFFPLARIAAAALHIRVLRKSNLNSMRDDAERVYGILSAEEKSVVAEFVGAGGCVVPWSYMNKRNAPFAAIESLIQRGVLSTSVSADGVRETFVLETSLFDVGVRLVAACPNNLLNDGIADVQLMKQ